MKKKYSFRGITICLFLLNAIICSAQSIGDIAFIAYNTDGNDDFAIVALADITPNTTIYFTDNEIDEFGDFNPGEGIITWSSGTKTITAGTIVIFTDINQNTNLNFGSSIGTITRNGAFGLTNKDGIIAYTGTAENAPTTFLAAIQIGNKSSQLGRFDPDGITLTDTGLTVGTTIAVINNVASPDGGKYVSSRSNQTIFSNYLTSISDKTKWTTTASYGDGEALLPFSEEAFTIHNTNWTGSSSNVWNLAGNWDNGVPTSASTVLIPDVATAPVISSGTTALAGNLTINAGEILTINPVNSLTVSGLFTITGSQTINQGGSLIVKGNTTGNLTYKVNVSNTNWHLVSSPVIGEQYDDTWNTTNSINVSGTVNNDAVSTYNNTTSAIGSWDYFQTGSAATTFNQAQGYSLKRTSSGGYGFVGAFPNTGILLTISQGFGALNKWNFVGNPFPSYIKVSELITANSANLTDTHEFLYVWNGTDYITLNGTDYIHPGQGFFVNADNSNANNFVIAKSLQSHQTGITFYKKKPANPTIKIFVNDTENNQKFTEIKYVENTTKKLDPGFDAGTFTAQSTNFSLFSHLVSDSKGVDFMLQSLPKDDYENTIIPLGLRANSEEEVTFSINHQNLPSGLMVFIEDKKLKTITRLDQENSNYKITLDADSSEIGRFYIRTSTSDLRKTLDTKNFNIEQVSIYLSSDRNLRIAGLKSDTAMLTIFNISGKEVYYKNLKSSTTINVNLSDSIKQGIYIIKLETNKGTINKKIFLK